MKIVGPRLTLEEFTDKHLYDPDYFSWIRDKEVVNTIYRYEYLLNTTFEEVSAYVKNLWASTTDAYFAIHLHEAEHAFVGTVRIGHINWRTGVADIGIMVGAREHWGKGIAKEAVSLAVHHALRYLSLRRLTGGTVSSNAAMIRCFESLGFVKEGELREQLLLNGRYENHILFGLQAAEFKPVWPSDFQIT